MKTLKKSLDVLDLFTREHPLRGVSEIAELLSINKSSVHFILSTFKEYGYLIFDESTRKYALGYKPKELANKITYGEDLVFLCMPEMKRIVSCCNEDVSLSVRVGFNWVVVALAEARQFVGQRIYVGRTLPLYCGGGKCFLAYAEEEERGAYFEEVELVPFTPQTLTSRRSIEKEIARIRQYHYTESREEYWPGAAAICFPVVRGGSTENIAAVLSVNSTTERINRDTRERIITCGKEGAERIARLI